MSQDRLDHECSLPLGTRDAVHVPFVVAEDGRTNEEKLRVDEGGRSIKPGDYVRFLDSEFRKFTPCDQAEAQGIVNPFLERADIWHPVIVFLLPGLTGPVRHHFDIDVTAPGRERLYLESELEQAKREDPACADCYFIENGRLQRM